MVVVGELVVGIEAGWLVRWLVRPPVSYRDGTGHGATMPVVWLVLGRPVVRDRPQPRLWREVPWFTVTPAARMLPPTSGPADAASNARLLRGDCRAWCCYNRAAAILVSYQHLT